MNTNETGENGEDTNKIITFRLQNIELPTTNLKVLESLVKSLIKEYLFEPKTCFNVWDSFPSSDEYKNRLTLYLEGSEGKAIVDIEIYPVTETSPDSILGEMHIILLQYDQKRAKNFISSFVNLLSNQK